MNNTVIIAVLTPITILIFRQSVYHILRRERVINFLYQYCRDHRIGGLDSYDTRNLDSQLNELSELGTNSKWWIDLILLFYK